MSEKIQSEFGFITFHQVADFADIHHVEVKVKYRGKGYGSKLMNEFLTLMKSRQVTDVTLEVRADHATAIALYEKFGFKCVFVRRAYYKDGCDGLLMRKVIEC